MLADTVIAERDGLLDRVTGGSVTALARAIQRARRFDLAPSVIASAYAVRKSPITSQIGALSLCRLPFTTTWFEWPGSDPVYRPFQENTTSATTPAPSRVGALVETDESQQCGVMSFAWTHQVNGLSICPLAATFDWRENPDALEDLELTSWRHMGLTEAQIDERILNNFRTLPSAPSLKGASDDELVLDRRRTGVVWSPVMEGYGRMLAQQQGARPGPGTPEWQAWDGDLAGEPNSLRCVILLLNSRNVTSAEHVEPPEKLNKARVRSGKAPLLDHTTIRIKLSRAMAARAGSSGDVQREAARLHLVRGHPKIRKTGVFWWSPHPRGDQTRGVVDQSYRLDP